MADCSQYQTQLNDLIRRANVVVQQYDYITGAAPGAPLTQLEAFLKTTSGLRDSILPKIENELFTLNNEAIDNGCQEIGKKAGEVGRQIQFGLSQNLFLLEANLKKTISSVSQKAAETQKATETQNNAGTGTPGTAPASNAAPVTANASTTTAATGTAAPATVPPTTGANATTTTTASTSAPAKVDSKTGTAAAPKPATTPVPATKGSPGTVEYISSLIAQKPTEAKNILATACPDKAGAVTKVKAILGNLSGSIAAQIPMAKTASGAAASQTEKNKLSAELQTAISKVGTTLKEVEALDCAKAAAAAATEAATTASSAATDPANNTTTGLQGEKQNARQQATIQDTTNFEQMQDWRVRLCLSPGADYLYKAPEGQRGILDPLSKSNGVVFPYTPTINVAYSANYDMVNPTHSNYKILQYTNSAVDTVTLSCDFTAQDTREANYLLAVIHFFRSVTKMWYGQDEFPKPGTPPPLVYLFGLGQFQFNAHPLVVTNFTYALPADVDYIRAGTPTTNPGVSKAPAKDTASSSTSTMNRLGKIAVQIGTNIINGILPGGVAGPTNFTPAGFSAVTPAGTVEPTYVPTKINLQITCMPVVSRNDVSNRFSLKDYGTGKLLRGTKEKGGGFW